MNSRSNTQAMETEKIPRLLAQLAIPAVVAQIINLLYNIVDRIYIGHISGVGAAALTGVGLFTPILMLINAFAMLAGSGGAPRAAISMGKKDNKTAEQILGNCFALLVLMSIILTIIFFILAPKLLTLFGASAKTLPYAVAYARIYILGSIFVLIVLGMNPFITTQGFAKISMLTTIIGAVINIILDPIFIFVFNLGVRGAAIATVLSQAVGAIWILRFLSGEKTILHLKKENFRLQKNIILPCLALGVSTFVMLSTESILSISFTSSLSRYGGDIAVGAMTIITSISQLATLPLQGICQGGQPIMSYNFGAGNKDRVKKAFFTQFKVCAIFTTLFCIIVTAFPRLFAGIFSNNTELITYTAWALRIYMAGIFSLGFQVCCQQSFMALGQAKVSLLLACLRKLILLIPLIFILPLFIQNKVFAVFLAEPISDILAAIITTITFLSRFNKILDKE
ncbi:MULTISPECIES: MATE family efflux transporter [Clostridia]|uniref:MATE family efflux transporter n=1 Tax=Clostridia TaxID=186801 RepID=UPI000EB242EA|nr:MULTISPECIES: MATE family efflux transporter [Clostridia]RKQ23487.1 MATE family efflux transporter [Ruminococcus sp. B05]TAP31407.1 MATE family efflux transporter [Mediterraneibacter sp. gm002]